MNEIESVVYEQCPYNWQHVREIYSNIKSEPEEDGVWYKLQRDDDTTVKYRRREGYFQFVVGDRSLSLYQELLNMEPMRCYDDAEWTIEKYGQGEYAVRTQFSTTFGPAEEIRLVDELLTPFGLWLEDKGGYISGASTFGSIEATDMLFACRRITMLERWCMEANRIVIKAIDDYWASVRNGIEADIAEHGEPVLMLNTGPDGGKRRQPYDGETPKA